jgi:hypothetical protein
MTAETETGHPGLNSRWNIMMMMMMTVTYSHANTRKKFAETRDFSLLHNTQRDS